MTGTRMEQAVAMARMAQSVRTKALLDYASIRGVNPDTTDCRIALERFILALRAEHDAMCEVVWARAAELKAAVT